MKRHDSLQSLLHAARHREWAIVGAVGAAWTAILGMASWLLTGVSAALIVVLLSVVWLLFHAYRRTRPLDIAWLTRTLDGASAQLEDSSALLLDDKPVIETLRRLQADRVRTIFSRMEQPDLRRPWPWKLLAISYLLAVVSLLVLRMDALPANRITSLATQAARGSTAASPETPRVASVQLTIRPPAYTGLPVRNVQAIGTRAPAGSALRWSLRVTPAVDSVALVPHDGPAVSFALREGAWQGRMTLDRSLLVRVEAKGTRLDPRLHRIEAVPDTPPRVRLLQPNRTLNLASPGQRQFGLEFEASDDYGVAGARLVVTLAQGSGENIGVRSQTLQIAGSGPARKRRFAASLDLAALGMQPGDDLIAQLHVDDGRRPRAQTTRSASAILRWPLPASTDLSSMEGLVQRILPAYFRSQRQIIIDSEALLAERGKLAPDDFVARSDAIGVDQRLLRLRYGQFLGEEGGEAPHLPGEDSPRDAAGAAKESATSLFADAHVHAQDRETASPEASASAPPEAVEHLHEEAPQGEAPAFGASVSVTEEFGHTHDIPEAATLLDPATQKLLRAALGEMWQAELHLRQGFPQRALPFENRALEFIKKVQQADRIYLAKVGSEIPPVDPSRRLTGKRDGLRDREDTLEAAPTREVALAALWSALGPESDDAGDVGLASVLSDAESWLSEREQSAQVLDAIAAIDGVQVDPDCAPCREKLRASLWVLLPQPVAGVRRRDSVSPDQRAYLDAVARERQR